MAGGSPISVRHVGRYAIYDPIATGGMATVHLGRLVGPVGFARTVAIKRLHAQYAKDPEFVTMFLDEARLAARIQHPNVVPTLDVIATEGELFLVMEYVRGESLAKLVRAASRMGGRMTPSIAVSIIVGALSGLHAAHEAQDESGRSLGIVHRDVSPQNVLVGMDGTTRVLDFGVAKAGDTVHVTKDGQLKGKLLYMAPEQLDGEVLDRRSDIYAMGILLFEALTGERMFPGGGGDSAQLLKISRGEIRVPSQVVPELAPFDAIVRKASARMMAQRYGTAREMGRALEQVVQPASAHDVGEWVDMVCGQTINERTKRIAEIESGAKIDRAEVRASLANELARSSIADGAVESSGVSSRRLPESASSPNVALRSRKWMIAVAVLALFVVFGGAAIAFAVTRPGDGAKAKEVTAAVTQPVAPPTNTPSATVKPADALAAPAALVQDPTGVAAASVDPSPTTAPVATARGARPAPKASASASAAPKVDCEQPYVVDSTGHMHFRKECL